MKKVFFLCLLTVSVCLSQPTADTAIPANKTSTDAAVNPTNAVPKTDNKTAEIPKTNDKNANHTEVVTLPPATVKPANETVPPKPDTNKNETVTPKPEPTPKVVTTTKPPQTPSTKETTTTPAPKGTTTEAPKPVSPSVAPPTLQARGFDGASFVGGIILTLGLLAVGFMGFRYYKTQTERNYHTL